jgi:glycosyltransferase involved in cell wall biosynthesis
LFGQDFSLALWLAKLIGVKIIYVPSGCHDEISKEDFQRITMPSICSNCGFFDKCNDNENNLNFKHVRRYSDLNVGLGYLSSREFVQENIKWKAIDKEVFHSRLEIPIHLKMKMSEKLRIYHGFVPSGRDSNGKSIKGSSHIVDAVEKLTTQGYQLELINVSTMNSNEVRFIQAQCDVIIDQLIYGWWGSTGVEGMALGKPVICYLRPEWKNRFMENYPQYRELPIIEASVDSIYVVLLSILKDRSILAKAAEKSVEFSKKHFDSNLNVNEFVEAIINL